MRTFGRRWHVGLLLVLLLAIPAAIKENVPAVGLNHLTLVPDSATFAAIAASPFLRDTFALIDATADAAAGDRIALVGRSTYIEFRRPERDRALPWKSGLALGTDERGALRTLAKRLTSEIGPVRIDSISRRRDSSDVPWIYQLEANTPQSDSTVNVRVVEYHPQFLRRWFGATPAASTSVARSDVLAMQARRAGAVRRFPFVDVVAIKIAASTEAAAALIAHCRGVAWRVQATSGGTACVGSAVRLFVVPSEQNQQGIVAFTMRVAGTSNVRSAGIRRFGGSLLRLSRNGLATWEFSAGAKAAR